MPPLHTPTAGPRLLTALAGAQLLVALDFSIIYVALPDIGADLRFSDVSLQWIVSAYAIFFAGFLLLGGQLADAFGGGRVYLAAQALFAMSSLAAGLSQDVWSLIAARAGQGVAAGLLVPATLGLLGSFYPAGPPRDRALSVWGTTGAAGLALGVVAGGGLLAVASWRWIFLVNLPIVAICLLAAGRVMRGRGRRRTPIALPATLSASAAVTALVLVFTEFSRARPSVPVVTTAGAATLTAAGLFVLTQRRGAGPLIPTTLLRVPTLRVACGVAALYMASFGAEFYLVTLYLQQVREYSALAAGLAFLPLAGAIIVGNTLAGYLAGRWTLRALLATAYLTGAVGLLALTVAVSVSGGYAAGVLPGLLLSGLGQGMAFTGMFITGTRDLPEESNGTGSALVTTAQYIGGSVGLAALVMIHGERPDASAFVRALCVTVVVAVAAVPTALCFLTRRRDSAHSSPHPVGSETGGQR
ncbi:MFS transporter [Streptomyces sp. G5(2025)]|uniref:MFS transporter n=1 Tax=Streptomyces sp. G5(2025) TaxID=3406628 RepID=UPI003C140BC2